ncbi:MAG: site-2 protease family protein [Candidatus Paceibacterota bacterium]|jgi:Zn-dependent protease
MQEIDFIFTIAALIMSVVVHEVSHGYVADILGDGTARFSGRLTLNPLKHLDPIGSFLIPVLSYFSAGFLFGWAKPVPYNPYNLKNQRWGELMVAGAGPLSNFLIAIVFGLIIRFSSELGINSVAFLSLSASIVFLNIILGVFNLVPIPPLDGSKVLFSILPVKLGYIQENLERYWPIALVVFVLFLWQFIAPVARFLFSFIVGVPF